MTQLIEWVKL